MYIVNKTAQTMTKTMATPRTIQTTEGPSLASPGMCFPREGKFGLITGFAVRFDDVIVEFPFVFVTVVISASELVDVFLVVCDSGALDGFGTAFVVWVVSGRFVVVVFVVVVLVVAAAVVFAGVGFGVVSRVFFEVDSCVTLGFAVEVLGSVVAVSLSLTVERCTGDRVPVQSPRATSSMAISLL